MTDLLNFTKKLAKKISYYEAIVDYSEASHPYNPFYKDDEQFTVIWVDLPNENQL